MYINIYKPMRCSSCNAIDRYERVTYPILNGQRKIIRCLSCGHEHIEAEIVYSDTSTKVYTSSIQNDEIKF